MGNHTTSKCGFQFSEVSEYMERTEFTYQRWFLKILCAGFILPLVYIIQVGIAEVLDIDGWHGISMSVIVAVIGMILYYKYTDNAQFFLKKGYYWLENEVVFIQRNDKVYKLQNVEWLKGDTTSAYGSKVGMLVVQYAKTKIVLYSKSLKDDMDFSNTELYPVFELILLNNPQLKKDESFEYWYEVEKRKVKSDERERY